MKRFLAISLMLFFAHEAMTSTIHFAGYDEADQSVHLYVSYCFNSEVGPGVEFIDEYCEESFPPTCFVSFVVYGESLDYGDLDTVCMTHWLTYDLPSSEPAQLVFQANDGSEEAVLVGRP